MVSVVVESNGIDDAVDWGLYSIIEKRIGEPKKDLQRNNLIMKPLLSFQYLTDQLLQFQLLLNHYSLWLHMTTFQ